MNPNLAFTLRTYSYSLDTDISVNMSECCVRGFKWKGQPTGRVGKLGNNDAYITGNNPDAAVLYVHDLLGWTFPNARLLADHFAEEAGVTVYVPDFFDGEVVDFGLILSEQFHKIDLAGIMERNSREAREPEIFGCARALREKYKTVGAIGYCYGGWAVVSISRSSFLPLSGVFRKHTSFFNGSSRSYNMA